MVWSSTEDNAQGKPLNETDSNALAKELLHKILLKRYNNEFQHCFESFQQRIWTEVPQKPYLTSVMKKKTLHVVKHHRQFVPHHMHIRWPLGKCFDKKYLVATMKHLPNQIIWGAMSCRGAVCLYFIQPNTTTNGPKYVELLKEKLKLHMHIQGCTIFVQDGSHCH